jgi:hypothetical protein
LKRQAEILEEDGCARRRRAVFGIFLHAVPIWS